MTKPKHEQIDNEWQNWINQEAWAMRARGIALMIVAVLGGLFGILTKPDGESFLRVFDAIIALVLFASGLWSLWWTLDDTRVHRALSDASDDPTRALIAAASQVVFGVLFLLQGISDGLGAMALLGLLLFGSAAHYGWRYRHIQHQHSR